MEHQEDSSGGQGEARHAHDAHLNRRGGDTPIAILQGTRPSDRDQAQWPARNAVGNGAAAVYHAPADMTRQPRISNMAAPALTRTRPRRRRWIIGGAVVFVLLPF